MRKKVVEDEITRLRQEVQGLSLEKRNERCLFELKMAQICILEKVLREGSKVGQKTNRTRVKRSICSEEVQRRYAELRD